jgi:hypothetical protein
MGGAGGTCRGCRVRKRNESGLFGRSRRRWEEIISRGLKGISQKLWIGFLWHRTGKSGVFL